MRRADRPSFPASAIPSDFGERVAAERRRLGWLQDRLAAEAGLRRETIVRIETGARRPASDTVFRLEDAMDLEPGELVPGWPEWKPIGSPTHGARSRERRRELDLSISVVASKAGVSIATLSRFEREVGATPSLARSEMVEGMVEVIAVTNADFSHALGFAGVDEHNEYCRGATSS